MKISRFNLNILLQEIDTLCDKDVPELRKHVEKWANEVSRRDIPGMAPDQEWVAILRQNLEHELTEFRERLGVIYDFMGDRGLTEFIPTRIRNERAQQRNGKLPDLTNIQMGVGDE